MADDRIQLIFDILEGKNTAKAALKETANVASTLTGSLKAVGVVAGATLAGIAAAGAAVIAVFKEAIPEANEQEDAINRLNVAMKLTGSFSKNAAKDFENFADKLALTSRNSDDAIFNQLALSKSLGATNSQAKLIVKTAADMSAALGIDFESAVQNLSLTMEGSVGKLGKFDSRLKELNITQLQAGDAIKILAERFNGAGVGSLNSFSGQVIQAKNAMNDLLEEIGFIVTKNPSVIQAIERIKDVFKGLKTLFAENKNALKSFTDILVDVFLRGISLAVGAIGTFAKVINELFRNINNLVDNFTLKKLNSEMEEAKRRAIEDPDPSSRAKQGRIADSRQSVIDSFTGINFDENKTFLSMQESLDKFTRNSKNILGQPLDKNRQAPETDFSGGNKSTIKSFSSELIQSLKDEMPKLVGSLTKGAAGVSEIFGAGTSMAATAGSKFLTNIGMGAAGSALNIAAPGLGSIVQLLSQGQDVTRATIKAFTNAIPEIVENIIESLPVLIEELVIGLNDAMIRVADKADVIIVRFANAMGVAAPGIAISLGKAMAFQIPFELAKSLPMVFIEAAGSFTTEIVKGAGRFTWEVVNGAGGFIAEILKGAGRFIEEMISGAGRFINELVSKIPVIGGFLGGGGIGGGIAGSLLGGIVGGPVGSVVGAIGGAFGFSKGGEIPGGFPNDSFPARLTSGERVLTPSENKALMQGVAETNSLLAQILMNLGKGGSPSQINVKIGERDLANILLDMDRRNLLRTA